MAEKPQARSTSPLPYHYGPMGGPDETDTDDADRFYGLRELVRITKELHFWRNCCRQALKNFDFKIAG